MSAIPLAFPPPVPFAELLPVIRPHFARLLAGVELPPRARLLEAGSSGGLLTALLAESSLAPRIALADLADPAPDTLEAAVARSAAWPWKTHFVNSSLDKLAARPVYDLILTWSLFPRPEPAPRVVAAVEACAKRPGWLITCHDPVPVPPAAGLLGYALHQHKLLDTSSYPTAGGRLAKAAALWFSTP